ncbi:MAG: TasA family protein [Methanomassiliicoccales archaeon]|jgi:predicted ribosomally synthesized peptide with SipW-like signal peptide
MEHKKNILIGVLAVAMVALVASGGLYAFFIDSESTDDNEVKAGTFNLTVNGADPWVTVPFVISDGLVYPGFNGTESIVLLNDGSVNGNVNMTFSNIVNLPGTTPEPEGLLGADGGELGANLDILIMNGAVQVYYGKLNDLTATLDLGALGAGGSLTLTISYALASTVGNVIMDDSVTFTIGFVMTQVNAV